MSKSKNNCLHCGLSTSLCICDKIPVVCNKTHVHLLIHLLEIGRPTNSGKIASDCLKNSQVEIYGEPGWKLNTSKFNDNGKTPLILFPESGNILSKKFIQKIGNNINLIVPDGNWRQAKKMYRKLIFRSNFPAARLPAGLQTAYHLRKETTRPEGLATFEAIAMALGIIEGKEICDKLLSVFDGFVDLHLIHRGKKRTIFRNEQVLTAVAL